jgi:putative tricarboxylic transport membrane protein
LDEDKHAHQSAHGADAAGSAPGPLALNGYRLACLGFLIVGLLVCRTAIGLTYYTQLGPAPGFFPFWTGALLTVFSAILLIQTFAGQLATIEIGGLPERSRALQIIATVAAIAGFALFVERIGFVFTMFGVLLLLLTVHGCRLLPTGLIVALVGSLGIGYAFTNWLGVYLPPAPGAILQFIRL